MVSALRTLGAETNGGPQLHQWLARMGEPLYLYQTPNGYSDLAETWVNDRRLARAIELRFSAGKQSDPWNAG